MCLPAGARGRVEQALLRDEDERPLRDAPPRCDRRLGDGDLVERAAEVHASPRARTASAVQGIGPSRAKSSLKTPGP